MADLGLLKPYDLRQIWQYEDRHFTVWLADNLERLAIALNMRLEFRQRERAVGPFSLDLLAHDTLRDRPVIIENQLAQTDHDHLGKLITYAAGLEASAIVWIAPVFRDQHRAALDWLNNHTEESIEFFGVQVEALQIDDSKPAVNFRVVAFPNNWQKTFIGQRADEPNDERRLYFYQFNDELVKALRDTGEFRNLPAPGSRYEFVIETTMGGIGYGTAFSRSILRAIMWITLRDRELNERVFQLLESRKSEIESSLGQPLNWDHNPARHGQLVSLENMDVNREDPSQIPELARWAARALASPRKTLEPRLQTIIKQATEDLAAARRL